MPAWREEPLDGLLWLSGGYSNRNWRFRVAGRDYAVRVVAVPGPRRAEAAFLEIPSAPTVVAFDQLQGHLVTEWIDAPILAHTTPLPEDAGVRIAQLHREIPAGVRRYRLGEVVDGYFERARQAGVLDARAVAAHERLSWQPKRLAGCHNDLNPWNILCTPQGWRTLDWETAGDNDPLFDVVNFCVGVDWDAAKMHTCLHAWSEAASTTPPSSNHLHRTLTAFCIREYAWAVAQLAQGNDRPEIHQQAADFLAKL